MDGWITLEQLENGIKEKGLMVSFVKSEAFRKCKEALMPLREYAGYRLGISIGKDEFRIQIYIEVIGGISPVVAEIVCKKWGRGWIIIELKKDEKVRSRWNADPAILNKIDKILRPSIQIKSS